ncbi:DJ-1/PfpI family protein [Bradyrhizobium sp. LHD-71]|uniref:DJ-1/PfpI family protein n=1 Tax=Bradyrhizobium sp. LHD-71 TaxID=3072141 RepID=UPI00281040F9|nr:DJ-1/PfpI family protein [Bradyrhizobium sp. LHD-71]MDQ8729963.1 DJ-1/PfpI family protein [Bradyrhizobium sp. LHD-71]
MTETINIGFLIFPKVTQLDFTGPLQVLGRVPGAKTHLVAKTMEPLASDTVLTIVPTTTFAACPQLDVICVPGGFGTDALLNDEETLGFLRKQAEAARYVTSVCTGALVLAAAGLLQGYRATTHWSAIGHLGALGAIPEKTRVCTDRNRITGGGVTAGIDFGLTLAEKLSDRTTAQMIQLMLEYNPAPPFNAGSPETAPAEVLERLRTRYASAAGSDREAQVAQAAHRVKATT